MPPTRITVDRRDTGKTVAAVLKDRLQLTWTQARRLVERHHVRYAGQTIGDPTHRVKPGKLITVAAGAVENKGEGPAAGGEAKPKPKPKPKPTVRVPGIEFPILFSDDSIVVIDKPAGLTTSRGKGEAAEFGVGKKKFLPTTAAELVPGLLGTPDRKVIPVHRLDKDTSGVMVFARTAAAANDLTEQFRKHTAERRYLALVRGEPKAGRIDSTLVDDRGDGRRGTGTGPEERSAVTHVKVVEAGAGWGLVECRLETGRTHQVRIHLGEAGCPLCGETVYDRPLNGAPLPDLSGATRTMLHAFRLGITHPDTGERLTWETSAPADFAQVLAKLRNSTAG